MSDDLVLTPGADDGEKPETHRVPRRGRSEERRDGGEAEVTTDGGEGGQRRRGPDPETAVAEAHEALEAAHAETADERRKRENAERVAANAQRQAGDAIAARFAERETAISNGLEAAKTAKTSAQTSLRAAREAGDIEAETQAIEQLSRANYNIEKYTDQKTQLDGIKERATREAENAAKNGGGDGRRGPTPEAQAWINRNPRYNRDVRYRRDAVDLHQMAIDTGHAEGSGSYIKFIDDGLEEIYGKEHGTLEAMRRKPGEERQAGRGGGDDREQRDGRRSSSTAAPRGGGGAGGDGGPGAREVKTLLGTVKVSGSGKNMRIIIPQELGDTFKEGAKLTRMTVADYALEQVRIADERAGGRNAGLVEDDDGVTYR